METPNTITLDGRDYVLVPAEEYRSFQTSGAAPTVDALAYGRAALARTLRAARTTAGLSQEKLAHLLGKSQPMVARAEQGDMQVGERYVSAVLKACGLPADWAPSLAGGARGKEIRGSTAAPPAHVRARVASPKSKKPAARSRAAAPRSRPSKG